MGEVENWGEKKQLFEVVSTLFNSLAKKQMTIIKYK